MWQRIVSLIIVLVIIIGGAILIYRFLNRPSGPDVKILTINSSGKFEPRELRVSNSEVLQIRNRDDKNHTVKRADGSTLTEIDQGENSRELTLTDNSRTELSLAADANERSTVIVGTPATNTPEDPVVENKDSQGGVNATDDKDDPLPNTGPGEILFFLLIAVVGFGLLKLSNRLTKKS